MCLQVCFVWGGGVLKESPYSFSFLPMAHVGAWGTVTEHVYIPWVCMPVCVGGCFEAQVVMRFYPPAGGGFEQCKWLYGFVLTSLALYFACQSDCEPRLSF